MKHCRDCGETKARDAFARRFPRTDRRTLRAYCRDCEATRSHRFYVTHGDGAQQRWRVRHPDQYRLSHSAGNLVGSAIKKGLLTRPNVCEACGRAVFTEAAHSDYSRPLDVSWLCRRCHREADHADPKTLRPADPDTREAARAA